MWPRSEVLGLNFVPCPLWFFFWAWMMTARHKIRLWANNWESSGLKRVWKVQTLKFFSLPISLLGRWILNILTIHLYKAAIHQNNPVPVPFIIMYIGLYHWLRERTKWWEISAFHPKRLLGPTIGLHHGVVLCWLLVEVNKNKYDYLV